MTKKAKPEQKQPTLSKSKDKKRTSSGSKKKLNRDNNIEVIHNVWDRIWIDDDDKSVRKRANATIKPPPRPNLKVWGI